MADTISNWTMFGVYATVIDIWKHTNDGEEIYNSTISFMLDDGTEDEDDKCVTVSTEVWGDDEIDVIKQTALSISGLFEVSANIILWDNETSTKIGEYNLNDIFGDTEETLPEDVVH